MEDLFKDPVNIPVYMKEAMMYSTSNFKDMGKDFEDRMIKYSELFNMKGEPKDYGDMLILENKDFKLRVYRQSDSFLLNHKKYRYRSNLPKSKLPEKEEAFKNAEAYLDKVKLTNNFAKITGYKLSKIMNFKPGEKNPELKETEAHVMYNFSVENIPIIGPGAKIKFSLIEGGKMSGLLYFWRSITPYQKWPLISPKEALKRFKANPRFKQLSSESASIILDNMYFGYYALTPTEFQRYLIPVYAIIGKVQMKVGSKIRSHDFSDCVLAVNISPLKIKSMMVVKNPFPCLII